MTPKPKVATKISSKIKSRLASVRKARIPSGAKRPMVNATEIGRRSKRENTEPGKTMRLSRKPGRMRTINMEKLNASQVGRNGNIPHAVALAMMSTIGAPNVLTISATLGPTISNSTLLIDSRA
jgi:hypothetical protein